MVASIYIQCGFRVIISKLSIFLLLKTVLWVCKSKLKRKMKYRCISNYFQNGGIFNFSRFTSDLFRFRTVVAEWLFETNWTLYWLILQKQYKEQVHFWSWSINCFNLNQDPIFLTTMHDGTMYERGPQIISINHLSRSGRYWKARSRTAQQPKTGIG